MSNPELASTAPRYTARPGRERGQNGWLEITGKTRKRWRGHFHVYELQPDGKEHRKHKTLILGLRSDMTRKEAADALRQAIAAKSELNTEKQPEITFGQFWRERFLPMHQQKWKVSSRQTQIDNIERYCVALLEDKLLTKIDRFGLQMQANRLADTFSRSVVNKFVTWSRAILEEAVDEDLLLKNPAKKLQMPDTREENKRFLALKEIPVVLGKLPFREQLIFRISWVLGLRPGELFALRWDDIDGYSLRLDESTVDGEVYPSLKTENAAASSPCRHHCALVWPNGKKFNNRKPSRNSFFRMPMAAYFDWTTTELMSCGRHWIASPKKLALTELIFGLAGELALRI
jgi:hypothetical protein